MTWIPRAVAGLPFPGAVAPSFAPGSVDAPACDMKWRSYFLCAILDIPAVPLHRKDTTLADASKEARDRAEAKFAKAQKAAREGESARAEHAAAARAVREKTLRLRSLRLAKEAAEMEAQPKKKPVTRKKKPSS
jgi:hypothetical protein